jgi:hypothetical protein
MTTIFDHLVKLRFYDLYGQSKFDHDHPQDYKIFIAKMVKPNLITTISTIAKFFVVEIVEICRNC